MKGPIFNIIDKRTDLKIGTMQVESMHDGTYETVIKWRLEMKDSEEMFNEMLYNIPKCKVELDIKKAYPYSDSIFNWGIK